jgi:hypothetical protein
MMANIFLCINKKRSNVHCSNTRCTYNYDNFCIHNTRIEESKSAAYVSYDDCGLSTEEDTLDDMYWY